MISLRGWKQRYQGDIFRIFGNSTVNGISCWKYNIKFLWKETIRSKNCRGQMLWQRAQHAIGKNSCKLRDHRLSTYVKFSEKLIFLTLWYTHVRVCIRGLEMLVFRKILRTYLMDDPLVIIRSPKACITDS